MKFKAVSDLDWCDTELKQGKSMQLRFMPSELLLKLFRISVSINRTDFVLANDTTQSCSNDTQKVCAIRWLLSNFTERLNNYQCRKQRIQRNHIACSIMVWTRLKQIANKTYKTVY